MASFNKFNSVVTKLLAGDLTNLSTDTINIYLTNAAPSAADDEDKADLAEIATGNGYTGPQSVTPVVTNISGVITLSGTDITITASGGSIGPFRYVALYDDTIADDPLLGWWDYGSEVTLADGESFTVDFGASIMTIS